MLKGIALLTLLVLPGSLIVLGLACLHPGLREKATALLGLHIAHRMNINSLPLQRKARVMKGRWF
ncbi:hypothetical protein [Caballeronia grimmiae]|uniref:hypothetical protein n=1 Tax=Caballeronia grimmiae TaxID=1071679 RepID=UPI0038B8FE0F